MPHIEDKNLNKLIETIIKMFSVLSKFQKIKISFKPLKKEANVLVDSGRIQQILVNILQNSIKHSVPDSVIKI